MKTRQTIASAAVAATLVTGGCLLALPASASPTTHTLVFTTKPVSQVGLGKNHGAEFDKDLNAKGKVIAYDIVSFLHGSNGAVALALSDGFIYAHLVFSNDGTGTGTVTGGAGKYAHATGTVTSTPITKTKSKVTLKYSL
jgi:hypothetical protein